MQTMPQDPRQASAQEVESALHQLRTLNVLDRLRSSCGVILEDAEGERECTDDERVARNYLADLPLKLRLRGLELYAETIKIGKTCPCPECFQALPTYHVRWHIERVAREQQPPEHEEFANLMTLLVFRTWNPVIANPKILTDGEFAADYRALFKARLEGSTALSRLRRSAMKSAVAGFPY